jgi:hypothetical protein
VVAVRVALLYRKMSLTFLLVVICKVKRKEETLLIGYRGSS